MNAININTVASVKLSLIASTIEVMKRITGDTVYIKNRNETAHIIAALLLIFESKILIVIFSILFVTCDKVKATSTPVLL